MSFQVKRTYAPPTSDDGYRVLVDRLWPRGLTKEALAVDEWLKDVAPSNALRQRYHGHAEDWDEFRANYFRELDAQPDAVKALVQQG